MKVLGSAGPRIWEFRSFGFAECFGSKGSLAVVGWLRGHGDRRSYQTRCLEGIAAVRRFVLGVVARIGLRGCCLVLDLVLGEVGMELNGVTEPEAQVRPPLMTQSPA